MLGNPNKWADNAHSHGLTANTTPAVGSVAVNMAGGFGHVAFVEKVGKDSKGDTILTVSEFNEYFDGDYNSRRGTPANLRLTKFVHFEKYEKSGTPTPTPTTPAPTTPTPTPTPAASNNDQLNGIAAVSANDVWAVGERDKFSANPQTLIEHWDGNSWSVVPSPSPEGSSGLNGVAAVSSSDVWAIGINTYNNIGTPLIEHWDGSSWSVVPNATPGAGGGDLLGVAAVSSNDVWAVGSDAGTPLIEHWDGSSWSVVPSPNPSDSRSTAFSGVAAVSSNDVWAVGNANSQGANDYTLIEHWNGSSWNIVSSPNFGVYDDLSGVAAISSNDVWAVGYYTDPTNNEYPLAEHWNGSAWSVISTSNPTGSQSLLLLSGVAAISSSDVWAVGRNYGVPVVEHWDGSSWSVVPSPNPAPRYCCALDELLGIAAVSSSDVWAVGDYTDYTDAGETSAGGYTLIEHWDGSSWSVMPSPNP